MLPQRGYLKEGYFADLTVFNEEEIRRAVPDQERSFGIEKPGPLTGYRGRRKGAEPWTGNCLDRP